MDLPTSSPEKFQAFPLERKRKNFHQVKKNEPDYQALGIQREKDFLIFEK